MAFRRPSRDEQRLLIELARIGGMQSPSDWLAVLRVEEMDDGGMGSLRFNQDQSRSIVDAEAEVQFTDEDGVLVEASLIADEHGRVLELDMWKVDSSPLIRIPDTFRPLRR